MTYFERQVRAHPNATIHSCKKCGRQWPSRKEIISGDMSLPNTCPRCQSENWNNDIPDKKKGSNRNRNI